MSKESERVYPYEYDDSHSEASFALGDHSKDDVVVTLKRKTITAGFKGEKPIIQGTLFGEIDTDCSGWSINSEKGIVLVELSKKNEGEQWIVLICPKNFHGTDYQQNSKLNMDDLVGMDFHSIYKWAFTWIQSDGLDGASATVAIKEAADAGHLESMFFLFTLYMSSEPQVKAVYGIDTDMAAAHHYLLKAAEVWESAEAFSILAESELQQQNYDEAIRWLEKSHALGVQDSTLRLAHLYLAVKNDEEKALRCLDSISQTSAIAAINIAMILYKKEIYDKCIKFYERALKIDPNIYEVVETDEFPTLDVIKKEQRAALEALRLKILEKERQERLKQERSDKKKKQREQKLKKEKENEVQELEIEKSSSLLLPGALLATGLAIGVGYFAYKYVGQSKTE